MDDEPPPIPGDEPPDIMPYPKGFMDSLVRVSMGGDVYLSVHRNGYGDKNTRGILLQIFGPGDMELSDDRWIYTPRDRQE